MSKQKQLTKEQAIKFVKSEVWKDMTDKQIVDFQLFQERLCMPLSVFQNAVENVFGRSVYTHEFGYPERLIAEYMGDKKAPTIEEIINQIPEEKRALIFQL